jgi:hypothetical protein
VTAGSSSPPPSPPNRGGDGLEGTIILNGATTIMSTKTSRHEWTPEAVRALGLTTDLTTAAHIIGIGRTLAFDLVRNDEFPVRILRVRGRILVRTGDLLELLIPPSDPTTPSKEPTT